MNTSAQPDNASAETVFRNAFEGAPVGMALITPDGALLQVNQALAQLLGYTEAELLARTSAEITHPEDRDLQTACQRKLLAGQSDHYGIRKRFLHRNGSTVWASFELSLARNKKAEPLFFIAHIQDVTREKIYEENLDKAAAEIARLRQGLLKICAWTKRIEVDSRWITVDEFLRDHLHLNLTHGMSVEGARLFHSE